MNPDTVTLRSRPNFSWWAILASGVFLAIGVWMMGAGLPFGWLEVILWGFGLIVLIATGLRDRHWLRLESDGFRVGFGKRSWRHAWADVNAFWAEGGGVAYRLEPTPRALEADPDEPTPTSYLPDLYGLTAPELLETLRRHKALDDARRSA